MGRSLTPLCAPLTRRDGRSRVPPSPASCHFILPCWCQLGVEVQLPAGPTGTRGKEADCWLLSFILPYSTSLVLRFLIEILWHSIWMGTRNRSAASTLFNCFIQSLCCHLIWRFSSPLGLTDTKSGSKVEWSLLLTYITLFRTVQGGGGGLPFHWPCWHFPWWESWSIS